MRRASHTPGAGACPAATFTPLAELGPPPGIEVEQSFSAAGPSPGHDLPWAGPAQPGAASTPSPMAPSSRGARPGQRWRQAPVGEAVSPPWQGAPTEVGSPPASLLSSRSAELWPEDLLQFPLDLEPPAPKTALGRADGVAEALGRLGERLGGHRSGAAGELARYLGELYGTQFPHESEHELQLAIAALAACGTSWKERFGDAAEEPALGRLATLMPRNMPLYSLILYAVMPAGLVEAVFVHLPRTQRDRLVPIFRLLAETAAEAFAGRPATFRCCERSGDWVLSLPELAPIRLRDPTKPAQSHDCFVADHVDSSDAFLVTGRFEAAEAIVRQAPETTLVIYNSSGINPAIVGHLFTSPTDPGRPLTAAEALPDIARRLVVARMFNNGQDCGAPDAIFVPRELAGLLVQEIHGQLQHFGYAQRQNFRAVDDLACFTRAVNFLLEMKNLAAQGLAKLNAGEIDMNEQRMGPRRGGAGGPRGRRPRPAAPAAAPAQSLSSMPPFSTC